MIVPNPFGKNTHIKQICNSVTYLHSFPDTTHLQKTYPNTAKLLINSYHGRGRITLRQLSFTIEWSVKYHRWTINKAPPLNNWFSANAKQSVYHWSCNCGFSSVIVFGFGYCAVKFPIIPWVAAQAVHRAGILKIAQLWLSQWSKSCDLQPSQHCSVQYVELRGNCSV